MSPHSVSEEHEQHRGHSVKSARKEAILFDHVPKCGGCTLKSIVGQDFVHRFSADITALSSLIRRAPRLQRIFVSDHNLYGVHAVIENMGFHCSYFSMLRNPFDRFVSSAKYTISKGEEVDLDMHLEVESNFFVNWFGGGDPETARQQLSDRYEAFGILERFEESLTLLQHVFSLKRVPWCRKNVSRHGKPFGNEEECYERFRAHNGLDLDFYAWACDLFERRLSTRQRALPGNPPPPSRKPQESAVEYTVPEDCNWSEHLSDGRRVDVLKKSYAGRHLRTWAAYKLAEYYGDGDPLKAYFWARCGTLSRQGYELCQSSTAFRNEMLPELLKHGLPVLLKTDLKSCRDTSFRHRVLRPLRDIAEAHLSASPGRVLPDAARATDLAAFLYLTVFDSDHADPLSYNRFASVVRGIVPGHARHFWKSIESQRGVPNRVMIYCPDRLSVTLARKFAALAQGPEVRMVCCPESLLPFKVFGRQATPLLSERDIREQGVGMIVVLTDRDSSPSLRVLADRYLDEFPTVTPFADLPLLGPFHMTFSRPYDRCVIDELLARRLTSLAVLHSDKRFLVFGAGRHTRRLEELWPPELTVVHVVDDAPTGKGHFWGNPVVLPTEVPRTEFDIVALSTDCMRSAFRRRCCDVWGEDVPLIDLYDAPEADSYAGDLP